MSRIRGSTLVVAVGLGVMASGCGRGPSPKYRSGDNSYRELEILSKHQRERPPHSKYEDFPVISPAIQDAVKREEWRFEEAKRNGRLIKGVNDHVNIYPEPDRDK